MSLMPLLLKKLAIKSNLEKLLETTVVVVVLDAADVLDIVDGTEKARLPKHTRAIWPTTRNPASIASGQDQSSL